MEEIKGKDLHECVEDPITLYQNVASELGDSILDMNAMLTVVETETQCSFAEDNHVDYVRVVRRFALLFNLMKRLEASKAVRGVFLNLLGSLLCQDILNCQGMYIESRTQLSNVPLRWILRIQPPSILGILTEYLSKLLSRS